MGFTAKDARRLWFIACATVVLTIPSLILMDERYSRMDMLSLTFVLAWPALLITSFVFLRFDRRLASVGFISCLLAALLAYWPMFRFKQG